MDCKKISFELTFTREVLGSASQDANIHDTFIASKAKNDDDRFEEIECIPDDELVTKGKTVFHRDKDGEPILFDYMVKGFFKEACKALRIVNGSESKGLTSYKSKIDNNIFVEPRQIRIELPPGGEITDHQRPLRAETARGPRTALANSESIPEGSKIKFTVLILETNKKPYFSDCVLEWMNYGQFKGLGQWRSSGKGSFIFKILE